MISGDCFERIDPFGQFSKWDFRQKLKQYKFKKLYTFIESCLNKFYKDYKKNKDNDISYSEYRSLMLKKLVLQRIELRAKVEELNKATMESNAQNEEKENLKRRRRIRRRI